MKINSIQLVKFNNNQQYHIQNTASQSQQTLTNGVYNPIYYKDYNLKLNFAGGRAPEEFYEYNKDRMPATMKQYLDANYAERSKLAPVQVLQEAYDDLSIATTVDDIRELYPNEPKFVQLKPANYANAKTGVLRKIKEIKEMSDKPEPLFKDGCDDLTTYIVKKIYLEGKTVKEIDKDFAQDINPIYELAARVPADMKEVGKNESVYFAHSTTYNLGIRFPQVDFWNSFISTREDYAQPKRIKLPNGKFVNLDSPEGQKEMTRRTQTPKAPEKPRKYNFKPDGVKRVSDTIANAKGDAKKGIKELKRRGRDIEELTFVQQYWSQIMSIATEKIHLSEELIDFNATRKSENQVSKDAVDKFIAGVELTKREQTPLQVFWNERPDLKGHFSNAISDTIILFTDVFGADGENPMFKGLLNYADSIKPEREQRKREHAKIQAEYDKLADELRAKELVEETKKSIETISVEKKATPSPKVYSYTINGESLILPFDIKEYAHELHKRDLKLAPSKLIAVYLKELEESVPDIDRFWLSCCYGASDNEQIQRAIYPDEEWIEILENHRCMMEEKHNAVLESSRNALLTFADRHKLLNNAEIRELTNVDVEIIRRKVLDNLNMPVDVADKEIQQIFDAGKAPLTSKEKNSARINLFHFLKKGEFDSGHFTEPEGCLRDMLKLISRAVNEDKKFEDVFKTLLGSEALHKDFGTSLRYILDTENNPEIAKGIKTQALKLIVKLFPAEVYSLYSKYPLEYTRIADMSSRGASMEQMENLARRALKGLK